MEFWNPLNVTIPGMERTSISRLQIRQIEIQSYWDRLRSHGKEVSEEEFNLRFRTPVVCLPPGLPNGDFSYKHWPCSKIKHGCKVKPGQVGLLVTVKRSVVLFLIKGQVFQYPVIVSFIVMLLYDECPWKKGIAQAKPTENQQTVLKDYSMAGNRFLEFTFYLRVFIAINRKPSIAFRCSHADYCDSSWITARKFNVLTGYIG